MSRHSLITNQTVFESDEVLISNLSFTVSIWQKFPVQLGSIFYTFGNSFSVIIQINQGKIEVVGTKTYPNLDNTVTNLVQCIYTFDLDSLWHNYVFTFQNGVLALYVGGSEVKVSPQANTVPDSNAIPLKILSQYPQPQGDVYIGPIATWNVALTGYYINQISIGVRPSNIQSNNLKSYFKNNFDPEINTVTGTGPTITQFPLITDNPNQGVIFLSVSDALSLGDGSGEQGTAHNISLSDLFLINYTLSGIRGQFGGGGGSSDYPSAVLLDSPYIYNRFEEASGNFLDSSGHNRFSTAEEPAGTFTRQDSNIVVTGGYSTSLGGVDSAYVKNTNFPAGGNFTLEIWFKSTKQGILFFDNTNGTPLAFIGNDNDLWFTTDEDFSSGGTYNNAGIDGTDGALRHFVLMGFDNGGTPWTRAYLNGVQIYDSDAQRVLSFSEIWIGEVGVSSIWGVLGVAGDARFGGQIDEFAVYDQVLSASRVLAHYNAGTGVSTSNPIVRTVLDTVNFNQTVDSTKGTFKFKQVITPITFTDSVLGKHVKVVSLSDLLTFNDTILPKSPARKSVSDSITYRDSLSPPGFYKQILSDQLVFIDSINKRSPIYYTQVDQLFFSQNIIRGGAERFQLSDLVVFTDQAKLHTLKLSVLDVLNLSDTVRFVNLHKNVFDGLLITDSIKHNMKYGFVIDSMALADGTVYPDSASVENLHQKIFSEINFVDSIVVKQLNQRIFDTLVFADLTNIWSSHYRDSITFTDSVLHFFQLSLTDTITFTGTAVRVKPSQIADTITFGDSLTVSPSHLISDALIFKSIVCVEFNWHQVPSDILVISDFVTGIILNSDNINNTDNNNVDHTQVTITAAYDLDVYEELNFKDHFSNIGDGFTTDDACKENT